MFEHFPYTNLHELNLDWIVEEVKKVQGLAEDLPAVVRQKIQEMIDSGELAEFIAQFVNENLFYVVTPDMTQEAIQAALNQYKSVKFASGTYPVYILQDNDNGYVIPSGRTVWFDNATVQIVPNSFPRYGGINTGNGENITLAGRLKIQGDRNNHPVTGSTHEWGHGLIVNGKNVVVSDVEITDCTGDGVYVNGAQNVYMENVYSHNNRRNAISVIKASTMTVRDSRFNDSNGTAPQAGISVESNNDTDVIAGVKFIDCEAMGNTGSLGAYVTSYAANSSVEFVGLKTDKGIATRMDGDYTNVSFERCQFKAISADGVLNIGNVKANSSLKYHNCDVSGNASAFIKHTGADGFYNVSVIDCYFHDSVVTGRPFLALGTRTNANNVIVKSRCKGVTISDLSVGIFYTSVEDPVMVWSLDNEDTVLFTGGTLWCNNVFINPEAHDTEYSFGFTANRAWYTIHNLSDKRAVIKPAAGSNNKFIAPLYGNIGSFTLAGYMSAKIEPTQEQNNNFMCLPFTTISQPVEA